MLQSKNLNYKSYVELKLNRNKFAGLLGFSLNTIEPGHVIGLMPIKEMHEQQNGFVHGGVISTLNDMACGFAAYSMVPDGVQVFTAEISVKYLRPGIGDNIVSKGWVVKPGKRIMFCESEIYAVNNGAETLISKATSIMAVVDEQIDDKYDGK